MKCHYCEMDFVDGNVSRTDGYYYCKKCSYFKRYWDESNLGICKECKKEKRALLKKSGICRTCYYHSLKKTNCEECGAEAVCSHDFRSQKTVCSKCRQRARKADKSTWKWCNSCSGFGPVCSYTVEGYGICAKCYKRGYR